MPRIRSVFPDQWTDEDFVSLTAMARLLAIAIRNIADDHGVFEWKPLAIKMKLLPADNVDVEALLAEMVENRICMAFDVGEKRYGVIRNFCVFQRTRRPSYSHPLPHALAGYAGIDGPDGSDPDDGIDPELPLQSVGNGQFHAQEIPDNVRNGSGLTSVHSGQSPGPPHGGISKVDEGRGMREEGRGKKTDLVPSRMANGTGGSALKRTSCVRFSEFWDSAYPHRAGRKRNRKTAEAKYRAAVSRGIPEETIIAGARAARSDPDVLRGFARDPTTWLNAEGWRDEVASGPPQQKDEQRLGSREEIW